MCLLRNSLFSCFPDAFTATGKWQSVNLASQFLFLTTAAKSAEKILWNEESLREGAWNFINVVALPSLFSTSISGAVLTDLCFFKSAAFKVNRYLILPPLLFSLSLCLLGGLCFSFPQFSTCQFAGVGGSSSLVAMTCGRARSRRAPLEHWRLSFPFAGPSSLGTTEYLHRFLCFRWH